MKMLRVAAALGFGTGLALAQTTHVVGPGGFAQVDDALAVAAPGDEVLVLPGSYVSFTANVGVTIRAAVPGSVSISPVVPSFVPNTVDVPSDQEVHLVGLTLTSLHVGGGRASLDECTVQANILLSGTTALTVQSAMVALQSCLLVGVSHQSQVGGQRSGLTAFDAMVTAVDSTFRGGNAFSISHGPYPGAAIHLVDSVFHGSGLVAWGGTGTGGPYQSQPAILGVDSTVWVSDSALHGGTNLGPWPTACAVDVAQGRLDRCVLTPQGCVPSIANGGLLLGVRRQAPMQSPGVLDLDYRTDANGLVAVFLADEVAAFPMPGLFEQPVWLDAATLRPLALVVADAEGVAEYICAIPGGLTNRKFWFQSVAVTNPLQVSPVVGGVVR